MNKRFNIQTIHGQQVDVAPIVPLRVLIGAKNHPAQGDGCQNSVFPSEFRHCPFCGCELLEQNDQTSSPWVPPYGAGNGLKLFSSTPLRNSTSGPSRQNTGKLQLPSRDGHFAFCVLKLGAAQRVLLAFKRDIGEIWLYKTNEKTWEILTGNVGGDCLPVWSWSLAADSSESCLCIPTEKGPALVTVNLIAGRIQVTHALGTSVGGAIRFEKFLLAPVIREDGFAVYSRRDGENSWKECAALSDPRVVPSQLTRNTQQKPYLSIPVVDDNRHIAYWPGRGGYVRVFKDDTTGGLSWEFKPYESNKNPATALIELGPPYRKTGSRSGFWQLCEDHDETVRDGIVNKIIKLDGDEKVDSEVVECGQFLSTGRASFSWGDDYWDDIHKRNSRIVSQVELRFPLLQLGEKGLALIAKVRPWEGRDEFGVFSDLFFNREISTHAFVRFVVEGAGAPEKALYAEDVDGVDGVGGSFFRVKIAELPEISAFVFEDRIHIYLPATNDCYHWPLELMEG